MTLRELLEKAKGLKERSTRVVSWYAHSQHDGYRPGFATVRGPFFRWFLVEKGDDQGNNCLADQEDDAKYAAFAMNALPLLVEICGRQREALERAKGMCDTGRAHCLCGRPNGLPAVVSCCNSALSECGELAKKWAAPSSEEGKP